MERVLNKGRFLTSAEGWEAIFLTLIFFFFPTPNVYAVDDETTITPAPVVADQTYNSPLDSIDKGHRTAAMLNYLRQEVPGWAPGLRETLHTPLGWIRSVDRAFASDDNVTEGNSDGFISPFFQTFSALIQPPSESEAEAMWLTPGYHHKGFLPFHDAMMTGMDFRQRLLDDHVQLDLRPYYGQNWTSLNGYGGAELGIGLTHKGESQPWGRIAVGYTDGASYLMDHGRGFNMDAELRFDDQLSLKAGVRNDNTDLGNYAVLRWKLLEFGK